MTAVQSRKALKGRKRRPRGVLFLLSVLLLGSALIRLGQDAGQAMARAADNDQATARTDEPERNCQMPEDLAKLLDLIREREKQVETRTARLLEQKHANEVARAEIKDKMDALKTAENDLRDMVVMADRASENDVAQLTKIYESMKPQNAATVFEEMDPIFAAGFLARIRPEVAAQILAGLEPANAHAISVIMAGRNAGVPTK